ncbi:putative secreted protein (Por secretion system target) [Nonlabens dokdonensis]|uniref:Secreted protein (Por secretion system target) n=2 Tax=Nonlabens dokdonensis TaxID=328515 RepID=A0ABX5PWE4_9FLAO|nr:S8 family serine peptidase [Nonlabens dokdonensis]PZX39100.1 putative secreted protein (Por secretion system target) [Nonlabens dokdonensis]
MKKLVLILFILRFVTSHAQDFHALVFFNDKPNTAASLTNLQTILTQRAIDRKARHNIPIDDRDMPMNQSYIAQIKTQPGITYKAQSKWFNCVHVVGSPADINALASLPFVSTIDFTDPTKSSSISNEDKFANMVTTPLAYGTARNQIEMIGIDDLHNTGNTGSGMLIAVTDSGFPNVDVNTGFAQLRNNNGIAGGWDFVDRDATIYEDHFHGSRVLSVMAGNDPGNFEGTAPDARYYLFRTEEASQETPAEMSYWVQAAERADSLGVDVINVSLGYLGFDNAAESLSYQDMNGTTAFISQGTNVAFEKGMLVVTSAGNSGNSATHPYNAAPADAFGAFSIGSVTANEVKSNFSSIGPTFDGRIRPDIAAQGSASATIDESGNLVSSSGTSFSAPTITGAIACLMQAFPNLTPQEIIDAVRASAQQFTTPDNLLGYGIPDFGAAQQTLSFNNYSTAHFNYHVKDKILYFNTAQGENLTSFQLFNLQGQLVLEQATTQEGFIDLNQVSNGLYFFRVDQSEDSHKLVIR